MYLKKWFNQPRLFDVVWSRLDTICPVIGSKSSSELNFSRCKFFFGIIFLTFTQNFCKLPNEITKINLWQKLSSLTCWAERLGIPALRGELVQSSLDSLACRSAVSLAMASSTSDLSNPVNVTVMLLLTFAVGTNFERADGEVYSWSSFFLNACWNNEKSQDLAFQNNDAPVNWIFQAT